MCRGDEETIVATLQISQLQASIYQFVEREVWVMSPKWPPFIPLQILNHACYPGVGCIKLQNDLLQCSLNGKRVCTLSGRAVSEAHGYKSLLSWAALRARLAVGSPTPLLARSCNSCWCCAAHELNSQPLLLSSDMLLLELLWNYFLQQHLQLRPQRQL